MSGWRVTVRTGPKVEKERAATLEDALDAVEMHARAAATTERRGDGRRALRRYEAGDQVAARVELRGPGASPPGVDVRGDGAVQAWTGRVAPRAVEPRTARRAYEALRRALQSTSVEP